MCFERSGQLCVNHHSKIRTNPPVTVPMIKVQNLKKYFGPKAAVNGVSFTVEKGQVLGFLGPNGAGKSTTMRMITGFIPPSAGEISVGGYNMLENPIPA